jgi:hypothetical protein
MRAKPLLDVTDSITFPYNYGTIHPAAVMAEDTAEQAAAGFIKTHVILLPDTIELGPARALVASELEKRKATLTTVRYLLNVSDAEPGDVHTLTIAERSVSGTFTVNEIVTRHVTPFIVRQEVIAVSGEFTVPDVPRVVQKTSGAIRQQHQWSHLARVATATSRVAHRDSVLHELWRVHLHAHRRHAVNHRGVARRGRGRGWWTDHRIRTVQRWTGRRGRRLFKNAPDLGLFRRDRQRRRGWRGRCVLARTMARPVGIRPSSRHSGRPTSPGADKAAKRPATSPRHLSEASARPEAR